MFSQTTERRRQKRGQPAKVALGGGEVGPPAAPNERGNLFLSCRAYASGSTWTVVLWKKATGQSPWRVGPTTGQSTALFPICWFLFVEKKCWWNSDQAKGTTSISGEMCPWFRGKWLKDQFETALIDVLVWPFSWKFQMCSCSSKYYKLKLSSPVL